MIMLSVSLYEIALSLSVVTLVVSMDVTQSRSDRGLEGPETQVMFALEFSWTVKYSFVSPSLDVIETYFAGSAK